MKIYKLLVCLVFPAVFAANIPIAKDKSIISYNQNHDDGLNANLPRGLFSTIKNGKKKVALVKTLTDVLSMVKQADSADSKDLDKRDIVDELLVKVFYALKKSGLLNSIIKMSLTDDEVRPIIVDITIDLIEADVIPYEEIFEALKDSGLAVDVVKFILTDPETRQGLIDFIKELIPQLISSGELDFAYVNLLQDLSIQRNAYNTTVSTTKHKY